MLVPPRPARPHQRRSARPRRQPQEEVSSRRDDGGDPFSDAASRRYEQPFVERWGEVGVDCAVEEAGLIRIVERLDAYHVGTRPEPTDVEIAVLVQREAGDE